MLDYIEQDEIAILAVDNPPVNALGIGVRQALVAGVDRAVKSGAKAVLIFGKGRTWFAGADIREFGQPPVEPMLPEVCNHIEAVGVPVIAAMHGTVLGGGLEVAMACHYRICHPKTKLGLPEVTLGILPGAGGTQRLPRLTGYDTAIEMITTGRPVDAKKALDAGIVDQVADGDQDAMTFGLAYAKALVSEGATTRPVCELPTPELIDFDAAKSQTEKRARGQRSPVVALEAVAASQGRSFADGLAEERRLFGQLMETDQRKALIHAFFAERRVGKLPELEGVEARNLDQLGIIGGGTMGAGIATSALLAGLNVTLIEMSEEAADGARGRILSNLAGAVKRGKLSQKRYDHIVSQALVLATDYAALAHADGIIEAVFESMEVKKTVFAKLDGIAKPGALLASNTSYLDINEIAACTSRPEDVIGLHFFSPAHIMRLLEVVVGEHSAKDVVAAGFALGKKLGKVAVRSGVCDGFIGNRILSTYRSCADHMVLDGASPYDIDRALEAFGFAMGPFAVADLAGLDIGWANRKRLAATRDPRERVSNYMDTLCEAGHFGQKTGRGYYVYEGKERTENPDVMPLIAAERSSLNISPKAFSQEEIVRRYMTAMVNEAAKVVGEGIARRPLDVDMVLLMGYGFPRYRGGPLMWADLQGLPNILNDIQEFARDDDFFWQAAPLLEKLVAQGRCFADLNEG